MKPAMPSPQATLVHERDCAPCAAAREVVEELAAALDPLDNWPDVEVAPGLTVERWLVAMAAAVLHRYPTPRAREEPDAGRG
jgi:hypothetical protein